MAALMGTNEMALMDIDEVVLTGTDEVALIAVLVCGTDGHSYAAQMGTHRRH